MKYDQIPGLVPPGEHVDMSAMNEGIFLSVAHVDAIESALANNAGIVAALNIKIDEQSLLAQQTAVAQQAAEGSLATANKELTTASGRITELEARVAELEEEDGITQTAKAIDGGKTKVPFHASPENPANKIADSLLGAPKQAAEA